MRRRKEGEKEGKEEEDALAKVDTVLPVGHLLLEECKAAHDEGLTEERKAESERRRHRPDLGRHDGKDDGDRDEDLGRELLARVVDRVGLVRGDGAARKREREREGELGERERERGQGGEEGERDALGEHLCEVGGVAEAVLDALCELADLGVARDLGLLGLLLRALLVAQLLLLVLLVGRGAEPLGLRHLVQVLLVRVELVVVAVVAVVDMALAPDLGVALLTARAAADDDARAEALHEVGELPRLLLDLLGARAVLDRVADAGDERLVALLVGRVGCRGRLARRRRDGREEDLARPGVGDESGL